MLQRLCHDCNELAYTKTMGVRCGDCNQYWTQALPEPTPSETHNAARRTNVHKCVKKASSRRLLETGTRARSTRLATRRCSAAILLVQDDIKQCSELLRGLASPITRQRLRARYTHRCISCRLIIFIVLLRLHHH